MKIAVMAAWNSTSGVAMHSEPITNAFIKMGHEVTVFTFLHNDQHGEGPTAPDEPFVIRCFGTKNNTNFFDSRPFIEKKFDILLVEDMGMIPVEKLNNIVPVLKRKAKIIHVVHENRACRHSWFYKIDWDKVIYFDKRQDFLLDAYPDAVYIPFPLYEVRTGDKTEARKKLGLPLDKKIVYSFAHRGYNQYYRSLPVSLRKDTVLLQVILEGAPQMLEELELPEWLIIRREKIITTEKFDDYLFASDACILHKFMVEERAVVSTTVFQALGTGCPVFAPDYSDFFQNFDDEIVFYTDTADLDRKLSDVLKNDKLKNELNKKAYKMIDKFSPEKIANQFLDVFKELLKK